MTQLPDGADDGLRVERHVYATPDDPDAVVLILVVGGGHSWPGSTTRERWLGPSTLDVDANELMWAYFETRTAPPRVRAAGGGNAAATPHHRRGGRGHVRHWNVMVASFEHTPLPSRQTR